MTFVKVAFVIFLMSIICGPIFALFVMPLHRIIRGVFYVPFVRKKRLQRAVEKGHIITAYLLNTNTILEESKGGELQSSGRSIGKYQYEYNGKKYTYRGVSFSDFPEKLTLYFENDPKYADPDDLFLSSYNWKKVYIKLSLVLSILIACMGMWYVCLY